MHGMSTISELADFFGISTQTLRYYDKIGLLKPTVVDPKTGYRYYNDGQTDDLYLIKSLKAMGLSLEEIKAYLLTKDIEQLDLLLKNSIRDISKQISELEAIKEHAEFMLGKIKLTARIYQDNSYEVINLPPRAAYLIGLHFEMKDLYQHIDILYKSYSNSQVYKKHPDHGRIVLTIHPDALKDKRFKVYSGIGFLLDKPMQGENCVELQSGRHITTYHIGPYTSISNTYRRLFEYVQQKGYTISGPSTEISIIDNAYTANPNEYITEIQLPVSE